MKLSVAQLATMVAFLTVFVPATKAQAGSQTWQDISDYAQYVPIAFALGETAYQEDFEGLVQLGVAGALTFGATELLKDQITARRPDHDEPGDTQDSFPSGHAATAWFAAAHVQRRYGCYDFTWSCWRGASIPYLAAGLTAYGRVASDRHHVEDVLASAILTEAIVYLTTDSFAQDTTISPVIEKDRFGLAIFKRF